VQTWKSRGFSAKLSCMTPASREQIFQSALQARNTAKGSLLAKLFPCALMLLLFAPFAAAQLLAPTWLPAGLRSLALSDLKAQTALLAAFVAVIVIHELGHLAAAAFMGFEVLGIAIGPIRIVRLNGRSTVTFHAKRLLSGSISAIRS
jgi:hypothetical protein